MATCQQMARLFNEGVNKAELGKRFGGSAESVRRALMRGGVDPSPQVKLSAQEIASAHALVAKGASYAAAARSIGRAGTTVSANLSSLGIVPFPRRGARAATWAGGEWVHKGSGDVMVWVSPEDPLASMRNRLGYVAKHRLAMARSLGRPLFRHETVHHIDGDHSNNTVENLQLRQGRHGKGIVLRCGSCGSHNIIPALIADAKRD